MIFICLITIGLRGKQVARNSEHGIEHALVADSTGAQLALNHRQAQGGIRVRLDGRGHSESGGPSDYRIIPLMLFLPPADAHIEADHTVLVARAYRRNIAIEIVFALNDLLRTLRDVGAVR